MRPFLWFLFYHEVRYLRYLVPPVDDGLEVLVLKVELEEYLLSRRRPASHHCSEHLESAFNLQLKTNLVNDITTGGVTMYLVCGVGGRKEKYDVANVLLQDVPGQLQGESLVLSPSSRNVKHKSLDRVEQNRYGLALGLVFTRQDPQDVCRLAAQGKKSLAKKRGQI